MGDIKTQPTVSSETEAEISAIFQSDRPWVVIVWDDPINLMTYVTYVFMTVFEYSKERATQLMMQVHNEGKSIVAGGAREEMERYVQRLHEYGLWATIARADQN